MSTEPASTPDEQSFDRVAFPEGNRSSPAAIAYLSPSQVFAAELSGLNQRSDWQGAKQLASHLAIMMVSGYWWLTHVGSWWGWPALVIYGFSIAAMFAPVHECVHRTAFASNRANDVVAWLAGLLSFYNSTFYRRYHKWHHRYTRIVGKDPELSDPTPQNLAEYLWQVSGIPWWIGKLQGHWGCAIGQFAGCPYIPETARAEVQRSVQFQLAIYGLAIAASVYFQSTLFVMGWLLPLAIGQPILRLILFAEHTGCTLDANPFANTRTTLTWAPLRLMMWNMSFHAEHHFCPSMPFHALREAHQQLRSHLHQVDPGYIAVNASIVRNLGQTAASTSS
jgi:fatty acid desaturase